MKKNTKRIQYPSDKKSSIKKSIKKVQSKIIQNSNISRNKKKIIIVISLITLIILLIIGAYFLLHYLKNRKQESINKAANTKLYLIPSFLAQIHPVA